MVKVSTASEFIQEQESRRPLRYISFESGKCHRRVILMSKIARELDKDGKEEEVVVPGLAVLHMFEELFETPILNPGYSTEGYELEPDYTDTMYERLIGEIFELSEDYKPVAEFDFDKRVIFSNFIKNIVTFGSKFNPSSNEERKDIMFIRQYRLPEEPTEIIEDFKKNWQSQDDITGEGIKYSDIFTMAFYEYVKVWMLENTSIKIAYTITASGNINGVPYYGAINNDDTEEGKHQRETLYALARVATVLSQNAFEEEVEGAAGLQRGSSAYYKQYNDWVNAQGHNRQIFQRPQLNGVLFMFDNISDEKGKVILTDEKGSKEPVMAVHGVSKTKLAKIKTVFVYDEVLVNPDAITCVFKYTSGETRGQMGINMSVARWEGKDRIPFKNIIEYANQTEATRDISKRISSYKEFPFDDFVMAFKKYLEGLNSKGRLDFIKEDSKLHDICRKGFDAVKFDLEATNVDVSTLIKGAGSNPSTNMVGSLGIGITAPQPQATKETPVAPQVEAPQVEAPQVETPVAPQQPVAPQPTAETVQEFPTGLPTPNAMPQQTQQVPQEPTMPTPNIMPQQQ